LARQVILFIGPYAEWLIPTDDWSRRVLSGQDAALMDEVLNGSALAWSPGEDWQVVRDGRYFVRYCAVSHEERAGYPQRPVRLAWDCCSDRYPDPEVTTTDWIRLDQAGEIEWFRSAFRVELERASLLFRGPPVFFWGLVNLSKY